MNSFDSSDFIVAQKEVFVNEEGKVFDRGLQPPASAFSDVNAPYPCPEGAIANPLWTPGRQGGCPAPAWGILVLGRPAPARPLLRSGGGIGSGQGHSSELQAALHGAFLAWPCLLCADAMARCRAGQHCCSRCPTAGRNSRRNEVCLHCCLKHQRTALEQLAAMCEEKQLCPPLPKGIGGHCDDRISAVTNCEATCLPGLRAMQVPSLPQ